MATEEIQISELELADSLLEDMLFPVESATDTNAATLLQLKKWLGSSLPTGFIIASIGRIDDARFTLLDGKTLSRTGTYEDFYNKVIEQVQLGNWFACSQSEYDEDLSSKGQCGRFVIETDYIRIPTLGKSLCSGVVNGTIPVVGNGISPEFINLTNNTKIGQNLRSYTNQYSGENTLYLSGPTNVSDSVGLTTDPSKSGAEGKINSIEVYYYMVISTEGQTKPISVDINKVHEDINLKANKDLSDVTQIGKETVVGWGMPDYSAIIKGISFPYTAPTNGEVRFNLNSNTTAYVNGNLVDLGGDDDRNEGPVALRVSKGDVVQLTGGILSQIFIPYKGV